MHKTISLRLLGALLAAGILAGCSASDAAHGDATASGSASLAVSVETGRTETIGRSITATGTVTAFEEMVIGSPTGGIVIAEVLVDEGGSVRKGDLLARLDGRLLEAQVAQQQAAIAEAEANLEAATAAETRGAKLLGSANVSQETQEARVTARRTAEAKLAAAQAALDLLQVQLDQTRIVAPADGTVAKRSAVIGSVVQTGTELFRIVRDGRLEIAASVAEQYLADIPAGAAVTVTDAAGKVSVGTVRAIQPTVDATTRLGTVRVALAAGSPLRPGMSARVSIETQSVTALTVPESALVWKDGGAAVFTVGEGDKVGLQPVGVGARANGRAAVTGLPADARVVTAGAGFLNPGDKVRVVVADGGGTAR